MAGKVRCEDCDRNFKNLDGLKAHNAAKHPELIKEPRWRLPVKKIRNWGIFVGILIILIGGIYLMFSSIKTLPPTSAHPHTEDSPPSHIMKEPMSELTQSHMLEHSDGVGPPGVIINYNCKDYECEFGLIEKLETFAEKYPDNLYVAPYKNMDAKIVLTRNGRIEILEEYDNERINDFILRRI